MTYDLYAYGNAMVDLEMKVSYEMLTRVGGTKGIMEIIDDQKRRELLSFLSPFLVKKYCGGSAANTLVTFSQLGGKGFYSCRLGQDDLGKFFSENLKTEDVRSNMEKERIPGANGQCLVLITPDGDRTMKTYFGVTAELSETEIVYEELKKSRTFFMEGYVVTQNKSLAGAKKAVDFCRQAGIKIAFTFSDPSMVLGFKKQLMEIITPKVDILFCNEKEAMGFAGKSSYQESIDTLLKYTDLLVLTLGDKGSLIVTAKERVEIAPYLVNAVDVLGAGDVYAGAFLYGLSQGWDFSRTGKVASFLSSQVVTLPGPRLTKEHIRTYLREANL